MAASAPAGPALASEGFSFPPIMYASSYTDEERVPTRDEQQAEDLHSTTSTGRRSLSQDSEEDTPYWLPGALPGGWGDGMILASDVERAGRRPPAGSLFPRDSNPTGRLYISLARFVGSFSATVGEYLGLAGSGTAGEAITNDGRTSIAWSRTSSGARGDSQGPEREPELQPSSLPVGAGKQE